MARTTKLEHATPTASEVEQWRREFEELGPERVREILNHFRFPPDRRWDARKRGVAADWLQAREAAAWRAEKDGFRRLPVKIERRRETKASRRAKADIYLIGLMLGALVSIIFDIDVGLVIIAGFFLVALSYDLPIWIIYKIWGIDVDPFPKDKEIISIDQHSVRVVRTGAFGEDQYSLPTNEYMAICQHEIRTKKGLGYMAELLHPDHSKNVVVGASYSKIEIEDLCKSVAKVLKLPIERNVSMRVQADVRLKHDEREEWFDFYWSVDDGGDGNNGDGDGGEGGGE